MNPNTPGGSSDFQQELLAIRQDPQVKSIALRWAGAPDLAEDILQAACCGLGALKHPERVDNLHAYFLKVLRNEASRLYAARRTTPVENPEDALAPGRHGTPVCGPPSARPIDETVGFSLQAQSWLKRLADDRDFLLAAVPARSDDRTRYRTVIYTAAEQVLRDAINAEPSEADTNDALQTAWPEYFDPPGAAANTCHQRFRRARTDVRSLLQAIVRRDELI
jgi:DNA-directed RNA polymerase specialized sigma24 family protein